MTALQRVERRSRKRLPPARPALKILPNPNDVAADKDEVDPRQGKALLRKLARSLAFAAVLTASSALAGPAAAETATPSPAAQIAHAEFLPYMDPPPGDPATVCLVDTGVDINPDTESTVVEREALDGGDPGDVWDRKHGTEMAMAMGAPINGWGTVGAWPLVRIVSVRAMAPGATSFPFSVYARAIQTCLKQPAVRVINLSFSGPQPSDADVAELDDYLARARRADVSVVAGAGNGGGDVEWPAAGPGVFAVGAGGVDHALCGFSARGESVQLIGPGCGIELADTESGAAVSYAGTSPAAAFVSAALAAIRSYRPTMTAVQAEEVFRHSASQGLLDVEAAFRAVGLGASVDVAASRVPERATQIGRDPATPIPTSVLDLPAWPPVVAIHKTARWATPRFGRPTCGRRVLTLRVTNQPRAAAVIISTYVRRGEFGMRRTSRRRSNRPLIRLSRELQLATIAYSGIGRADSLEARIARISSCDRTQS